MKETELKQAIMDAYNASYRDAELDCTGCESSRDISEEPKQETFREFMEIVGYPEGSILKITKKQFNLLNEKDLIMYDDEWTKEKPNGQWGFNNSDENVITKLIKDVKIKQETLEEICNKINFVNPRERVAYYNGLKNGAKWQQERMYSEEDLRESWHNGMKSDNGFFGSFEEWFQQFKK